MHIALTMTRRRHQRLHHTGESDLIGSSLELLEGLGIEILGSTQTQLLSSEITDSTTVHREVHGTGRRNHLDALFLELEEALCTDGLNLRHDDIGLVLVDYCLEGITVEH